MQVDWTAPESVDRYLRNGRHSFNERWNGVRDLQQLNRRLPARTHLQALRLGTRDQGPSTGIPRSSLENEYASHRGERQNRVPATRLSGSWRPTTLAENQNATRYRPHSLVRTVSTSTIREDTSTGRWASPLPGQVQRWAVPLPITEQDQEWRTHSPGPSRETSHHSLVSYSTALNMPSTKIPQRGSTTEQTKTRTATESTLANNTATYLNGDQDTSLQGQTTGPQQGPRTPQARPKNQDT